MAGAQRRRCCCTPAVDPPTSCSCTGCPTSLAFTITANLTMTFDDGVDSWYWEWSYTGLAGIFGGLGGGGGVCSASADNTDLDGSMDWAQTYDAGEPASGTCSLPLASEFVDALVSFGCGLTLFSPAASAAGVTTPTYWYVLVSPIPRKDVTNTVVCSGSPFGNGGNGTGTPVLPGMQVFFNRFSDCWDDPGVAGIEFSDALWAGTSCVISGSSGSCTSGDYTFTGGASVALT